MNYYDISLFFTFRLDMDSIRGIVCKTFPACHNYGLILTDGKDKHNGYRTLSAFGEIGPRKAEI